MQKFLVIWGGVCIKDKSIGSLQLGQSNTVFSILGNTSPPIFSIKVRILIRRKTKVFGKGSKFKVLDKCFIHPPLGY